MEVDRPEPAPLVSYPLSEERGVGLPRKIYLVVNGIFNQREDVEGSARKLQEMAHIDVRQIRVFFADQLSAREFRPPPPQQSQPLNRALEYWGYFLTETARPSWRELAQDLLYFAAHNCEVEIHCHSRGGLLVDRALKETSLSHCLESFSVINYSGVRLISPDRMKEVTNVVNLSDCIAEAGRHCLGEVNADDPSSKVYAFVRREVAYQASQGLLPVDIVNSLQETMDHVDCLSTIKVQLWFGGNGHDFQQYLEHYYNPRSQDNEVDAQFTKRLASLSTVGIMSLMLNNPMDRIATTPEDVVEPSDQ